MCTINGFGSQVVGLDLSGAMLRNARRRREQDGARFGLVQNLQASAMLANRPTPWMGAEERICAYAPMLWFAVLAIGLLRAQAHRSEGNRRTQTTVPTMTRIGAPPGR